MCICNLGSGLLATDYELLQSAGTKGRNIRPNRLSHIYIYIYISKSSMNMCYLLGTYHLCNTLNIKY